MYILRGCGRRVIVGACIQDVKCVHNREGGVGVRVVVCGM